MIRIIKEFKEFSIKGNMIDIAVGMILGAAFNGVINTLVTKVLMPPFNFFTVDSNFINSKLVLRQAVMKGEEVIKAPIAIEYGTLITQFINFFIVALCVFFLVKISNKIRKKAQDPENEVETTPEDIKLLSELKGIMKEQNELLKSNLKNTAK